VNIEVKFLLKTGSKSSEGKVGLFPVYGQEPFQGIGSQFVRSSWAWYRRQQCNQTTLLKSCRSVIDGGAGNSELHSDLSYWLVIGCLAANHLVADLKEVASVEERIPLEQRIGNTLRMRVQGVLAAKT
jgi:hypothetical protein